MPSALRIGTREWRTDHLTLDRVQALERAAGKRWRDCETSGSARDVLALLVALLGDEPPDEARRLARALPACGGWLVPVDEDLPWLFTDGMPRGGGLFGDDYLAAFGNGDWHWPPDVVRRQRVRDLDLLLASKEGMPR